MPLASALSWRDRRAYLLIAAPALVAGAALLCVNILGAGLSNGPRAAIPDSMFRADLVRVDGAGALAAVFHAEGFDLDKVAAGSAVPPLFSASLPEDIDRIPDNRARKSLFIRAALPLVLLVNETIGAERRRLLELKARVRSGARPSADERDWLADLSSRYGGRADRLDDLLKRVDIVPPSLALAQAALETGWGTSRPAREGNALFGEMMVDAGATIGGSDRVRPFADLLGAVDAYARNLNSHRAYADFREVRSDQRRAGARLDGYRLARHLRSYSERRDAYVSDIRGLIRMNGLARFDAARLDQRSRANLIVARR
jgi:Bax protein